MGAESRDADHAQDARVAARARLEARPKIGEQFLDDLHVAQARERPAAVGVPIFLGKRDEGSTTRRSSFAFGSVVRMVSCRSSETDMLRISACRCELLRDS